MIRKVQQRRRVIRQRAQRAIIDALKSKGLFTEELDTWGANAYPFADAHTFTVEGLRWFVREITPRKTLRMSFILMARSYSYEITADGLAVPNWELYREFKRAIDFGAFLVREWPSK